MVEAITKQRLGLDLADNTTTIRYELRSKKGFPVCSFYNEVRAKEEAEARGLRLFRVTMIYEELK